MAFFHVIVTEFNVSVSSYPEAHPAPPQCVPHSGPTLADGGSLEEGCVSGSPLLPKGPCTSSVTLFREWLAVSRSCRPPDGE